MHTIGGIRPLKPELPFMVYWPESFRDKSELPPNGANVRKSRDAVIHHTGFMPVGNTKTRSSQRWTLFVSLLEPPFVRWVIQWTCKPQVGLHKSQRANTYSRRWYVAKQGCIFWSLQSEDDGRMSQERGTSTTTSVFSCSWASEAGGPTICRSDSSNLDT